MMRFLKNPKPWPWQRFEFQFLRYSWCLLHLCTAWHVYLYVFVCNHHPSSTNHPWRTSGPRHYVVIKIFLDIHLLSKTLDLLMFPACSHAISFPLSSSSPQGHGQQLPNLSLSCQTASFVELTIQYRFTIQGPCANSRCCVSPIWTKLNLRGWQICFFRGVHWVHFYFPFNSAAQLNPHLRLVLLFQSHHSRAFQVEASCYEASKQGTLWCTTHTIATWCIPCP